jgi:sugar-specific transcriptional regulator TrmB/DNA-binding CsgD family transcriptional regulator
MLTVLGATPAEDRVYASLATTVSATEEEIADATGLDEEEVRTALGSLIARGLANPMPESPARFVAASPGVVEAMIAERLGELRSAQEMLDGLASQYRAKSLARAAGGVFEIVHGGEELRRTSINLLASARTEVLNLIKPPIIAVQSDERILPSPSSRGRLVFETGAVELPGSLEAIRAELRAQDEVRVHTKLPIKMLAVDRAVALLPLAQRDTTPVGVLVRESALLDALLALFEYVWASAIRLHVDSANNARPPESSVISDEDRRLLSLLLAGLSDEAIALHRGTSVRTVQRRVQALMLRANVRTRMQLAWEAARQEWV